MLLKRTKNGLDKVTASIMDVDSSSLFDIFVPKQLRAGKNEIRIRLVNDGLVKGSDVLIDVLDQNKEPLYYEISDVANEDNSRSIIVHVTESDLTGKAYLYVYAKLGIESSYMTLINLEVNPELESEQEIKLSEPPEIFYSERRLATQTYSNSTREIIKKNNNGNVYTISPIIPKQLIESTFTVEKAEIRELKSDNTVGSGSTIQLPKHFDLARINSINFPFSSSYKNGTIEINGINLEVPNDAIITASFFNQSYSASIVNVISTSSIEIYPPFSKLIEYQTLTGIKSKMYDRFNNQANFTCSYFEVLTLAQSNYTQSYAVFDLYNLNTVAGKIDSVDISYKNLSLIGDNYEPLGNFKVKPVNYLIDSSSLFFDNEKGIIERPIGTFKNGVVDFQTYWQTSSLASVIATDSVPNGIKLSGNEVVFEPKIQFNPINRKETEWNLSFDFNLQPSQSGVPQLDIFVSGSNEIKTGILKDSPYQPYSSSNIGTYIGSVTERSGKGSFNFSINDPSRITPKFALRRGFLSIGNVTLTPVEKVGYNASQTRIYAPMNLPTGSEVNFKIDYVNPVGKRLSKFTSLLPGVYFEGSFKPSSTGTTIPTGTVSGSDQLTGSFDNRYHRLGTGLLSSSNQIATDISGSFISSSNSLSGRISVFESKTLISSSNQIPAIELVGILEGYYESRGTGILSGSGQIASDISGSFTSLSGSFANRIYSLERTTGSLNSFTASIQSEVNNLKIATGSINPRFSSIEQTTGSLNTFSGSAISRLSNLEATTGSLNVFSGSANTRLNAIEIKTGSYATTGSNQFNGNQSISGSINSNGSIRALQFSGSFSGSFAGNGSLLTGIVSSSYALSASYAPSQVLPTGLVSASAQVDYNSIQNKINLITVGANRVFTSDGSVSGSVANKDFTYITSSLINRTRLNNAIELEKTVSSSFWSSDITYLTQSLFSFPAGVNVFFMHHHIFKENETFTTLSSSAYNASYAIRFETQIYGYTGSLAVPKNAYMWATTTEVKSMINSFFGATPIFSNAVTVNDSASSGSFGTTFSGKADLSSWLATSTITFTAPDQISIRFSMSPTGSGTWNFYVNSVCRVIKNEIKNV